MAEKIFLSYAHKDRAVVDKVKRHLREQVLSTVSDLVFLDPQSEIQSGDNIREIIRSQMMAASKVVIVTSANSAQSQWVNYEAGMASALGKPVLVVGSGGLQQSQLLNLLGDAHAIMLDDVD